MNTLAKAYVEENMASYAANKGMFHHVGDFARAAGRIRVPPNIRSMSCSWTVEVEHAEGVIAEQMTVAGIIPTWVCCRQASIHNDDSWYDKYFLTFVVIGSNHTLAGMTRNNTEIIELNAQKGSLFIFDPLIHHNLFDRKSHMENTPPKPWASLQWEIPRNSYKKVFAEVCCLIDRMNQSKTGKTKKRLTMTQMGVLAEERDF